MAVEINESASVIAVVHDAAGAGSAGATAFLFAGDGCRRWLATDARGEVRFEGLPPGRYTVGLVGDQARLSFPLLDAEQIELGPGERRRVELRRPATPGTRTVRLAAEGVDDYRMFEVRDGWRDDSAWQRLERDGVVPIELTQGEPLLQVQDRSGRRWYLRLATWPPRDGRVAIAMEGSGYEGTVLDATTASPVANLRVVVLQRSGGDQLQAEQSAVTDAQGRFRIQGLRPVESMLVFSEYPDNVPVPDLESRHRYVRFQPRALPAQPLAKIVVRLPHADAGGTPDLRTVPLRGTVRWRGTLEPLHSGRVTVTSVLAGAEGDLLVAPASSTGDLDREGRFSVTGPIAPVYRVTVAIDAAGTLRRFEVRARGDGDQEPFDLLVE